jgi:membrane-bound lytic murein transglycosylase D
VTTQSKRRDDMVRILTVVITISVLCFASLGDRENNFHKSLFNSVDIISDDSKRFVTDVIKNNNYYSEDRLKAIILKARFLPNANEILAQNGIPDIFLYIPVIESKYSVMDKYSTSTGMWQLTQGTAEVFGMKIDKKVDERIDPIKSTKIVSKYLNKLYAKFDKWYLVVLAYNCGEGTLDKAIKELGSDAIEDLMSNRSTLPSSTKSYFKKLITIYYHSGSTDVQNIISKKSDSDYKLSTVELSKKISIYKLSKALDMSPNRLLELNRHIKKFSKNNSYKIYIPSDKLSLFNTIKKDIK